MAQIPATRARMDLFDRLFDAGVARRRKVLWHAASDRLRLALLDKGSDEYALFWPAERDELLFRALRHLAVGGGLCQYDDSVTAVLDSAKAA